MHHSVFSCGFALVASALLAATEVQAIEIEVAGYELLDSFTLPAARVGDVVVSQDGSSLLFTREAETSNADVASVVLTRSTEGGRITALGQSPSAAFGHPNLDIGLEFEPGGSALYLGVYSNTGAHAVARRDTAIVEVALDDGVDFGGVVFVPDALPTGGQLLVAEYENQQIRRYDIEVQEGGAFSVTDRGLFANLVQANVSPGDLAFVPSGGLAGDLLVSGFDGNVYVVQVEGGTGLPVGGVDTPSVQVFASGISNPWGLGVDPVTGHLFVLPFSTSSPSPVLLLPEPRMQGAALAVIAALGWWRRKSA